MAGSWHPLDLGGSADENLPPLLISTAFEADAYTIHLTDLTHIWVESLDHATILQRAEDENTSVDPSDSSQLQILLVKLGLALSSDPKSKLNLQIDRSAGSVRPAITLNLTIELPGGLAPLEWPIHLAAAPQILLTNRLVIPLIHAQHSRVREIEALKDILAEKEHVIQKLMDKMEAQGTDLGQVFPQATAKGGRKVDRARAEEKVRGLRPLEMQAWKKDLATGGPTDTEHLLQQVFTGDTKVGEETGTATGEDNWWDKIKNEPSVTRTKTPAKPALKARKSTQDNTDFQVQLSPAHRAVQAPKVSPSIALDASTDEEDLDATSQHSRVPDSYPSQPPANQSRPKSTQLGKIGGKKETPKKPSPPPADDSTDNEEPLPAEPSRGLDNVGRKKKPPSPKNDDTTEDDEQSSPQPTKKSGIGKIGGRKPAESPKAPTPPPPVDEETTDGDEFALPPSKPTPRSKGKLGKIGGKKEAPPPPSSPSPSPSPPPVEAPKPKKGKLGTIGGKEKEPTSTPPMPHQDTPGSLSPVKRKLGVIGGRNKTSSPAAEGSDETRGRAMTVEKKEETPPPRETSEERAEKKRRELKRDLEEKAKAPVKKKRKKF